MDKVIELAKQAGFAHCEHYSGGWMATMERFYTLARADLQHEYEVLSTSAGILSNKLADLEAEVFRLREHIIDQTKLEQEINQLRKERQAFKDVTEYQKSENDQLLADLKVCQAKNRELWRETTEFHLHADTETKRAVRAALGEK